MENLRSIYRYVVLITSSDQGQFSGSFLQTNFEGCYECFACHVLAPDLENFLQHESATLKVVGRILARSKLLLRVYVSHVKCCMNNSEKFFCNSSFTDEVSITVNLGRWEDADVRLLR